MVNTKTYSKIAVLKLCSADPGEPTKTFQEAHKYHYFDICTNKKATGSNYTAL